LTPVVTGYGALLNAGFSAYNPPADRERELEGILGEHIERWTRGLTEAGIAAEKNCTHFAGLGTDGNGDPLVNDFSNPGLSMYVYGSGSVMKNLIQQRNKSAWCMSEGTNLTRGVPTTVSTETYLANIFNNGARMANIFGWHEDTDLGRDTRSADSLAAYQKFLRGEALVEGGTSGVQNGLIAYEDSPVGGGVHQIFVYDPDTGAKTQLTNDTRRAWRPIWSPDGTHLVYLSESTGTTQIRVMKPDGSNNIVITTDTTQSNFQPAWSPDSQTIAYTTQSAASGLNLHTVRHDGTNHVQLTTEGRSLEPTWSPDGNQIVLMRNDASGPGSKIWIMQRNGTNAQQLTFGSSRTDGEAIS